MELIIVLTFKLKSFTNNNYQTMLEQNMSDPTYLGSIKQINNIYMEVSLQPEDIIISTVEHLHHEVSIFL